MKLPSLVLPDLQSCSEAGLNPFALTLLAESVADDPKKFPDIDKFPILACASADNGTEVWFCITTKPPVPADFDEVREVTGGRS